MTCNFRRHFRHGKNLFVDRNYDCVYYSDGCNDSEQQLHLRKDPGQSDPRRNPSMDAPLNWGKPGCQSGLLPPGQTAGANPGQCQKAGI
jgi:hypothetical protein